MENKMIMFNIKNNKNKIEYVLMHQDFKVMEFLVDDYTFKVSKINKIFNIERVPFSMQAIEDNHQDIIEKTHDFTDWIIGRLIPSSRANELKKQIGSDILELVYKTHALSLADHYWVRLKTESHLKYKDINYYENDFSSDIGDILFGSIIDSPDVKSPDTVTDGMVKKKWKLEGNKRVLIKGGDNFRKEPFNEKVASIISKHLGFNYINYNLYHSDNTYYSNCYNFLQEQDGTSYKEYVTAYAIRTHFRDRNKGTNAYESMIQQYTYLGIKDARYKLEEMIVLDYVIGNIDRHYGNFGLIRDINTLEFIDVVPIFDTGMSMYWECNFDEDTDKISFKPFNKCGKDNLGMVTDFSRFRNIKPSLITDEIEEFLSKYNLQNDVALFTLRERLLEIKNKA